MVIKNFTRGRKRKIFTTIALALSLLFGKPRSSSSQSSSPNFDNQTIYEKVILIGRDSSGTPQLFHLTLGDRDKVHRIFLHRRLEVDLVGLYMYQNIV